MTLVLHEHPFASYCWKALIAAYERAVPFERLLIDDDEARARHSALWPLAGIPVLVDGDVVVPESSTVIEYLDRFGGAPPMIPADPDAALRVRVWDRVMDGNVMTPMQTIVFNALRPDEHKDPFGVDGARATLDRAYGYLESQLGDGGWRLLRRESVARVVDEARPYRELFPLPWPAYAE